MRPKRVSQTPHNWQRIQQAAGKAKSPAREATPRFRFAYSTLKPEMYTYLGFTRQPVSKYFQKTSRQRYHEEKELYFPLLNFYRKQKDF